MRCVLALFSSAIDNTPVETVGEIFRMLGKISSAWAHAQFSENGDLERNGCGEPLFISVERIEDPLHD